MKLTLLAASLQVLNPLDPQKDMILKLMEHSTNMDCPNVRGITPVQLFVSNGVLDMAHLLLLNGAHVNQSNQAGKIFQT